MFCFRDPSVFSDKSRESPRKIITSQHSRPINYIQSSAAASIENHPKREAIQIPSTSPSGEDILMANNAKKPVAPQRLLIGSRKSPRKPPISVKNMYYKIKTLNKLLNFN